MRYNLTIMQYGKLVNIIKQFYNIIKQFWNIAYLNKVKLHILHLVTIFL